jgi:hypothetical protein
MGKYTPDGLPLQFGIPDEEWVDAEPRKRIGVVLKVYPPDHLNNKSKVMTECDVFIVRTGAVVRAFAPTMFVHGRGRIEWLPKESSGVSIGGDRRAYKGGKLIVNPYDLDGSWVIVDMVEGVWFIDREIPKLRRSGGKSITEAGKLTSGETFKIVYDNCEISFKNGNIYVKIGEGAKIYLVSEDADKSYVRGEDLKRYLDDLKKWLDQHTHKDVYPGTGTSGPPAAGITGTQNPSPNIPDILSDRIKGK